MFDRINDSLSHNSLQLNGENMKWWLRLSFCFHGRKTVIRVSNNMRDEYMMYVIAILILGERIFYFPFPSFFFYFLLNLCMKLTISSYVLSFIHSSLFMYLCRPICMFKKTCFFLNVNNLFVFINVCIYLLVDRKNTF